MNASRSPEVGSLRASFAPLVPWLAAWGLFLGGLWHPAARGQTPDSPEVRAAVEKGLDYLEKNDDPRPGGMVLLARVMLHERGPAHRRVAQGVAAIERAVENLNAFDNYSLGLSLIFLAELGVEKHRPLADQLIAELLKRQKEHGGWGYAYQDTGDTSMTQYTLLGAWMMAQAGLEIPTDMWRKALEWLLRTQDPSGGHGYQGVVASGEQLVRQEAITVTLTAAAWASFHLCGDRLGMIQLGTPETDGPPSEFERVSKSVVSKVEAPPPMSIEPRRLTQAMSRCAQWFEPRERELPLAFVYYYFYTRERLESVREAVKGDYPESPPWYIDGVKYILGNQRPDGSWFSNEQSVPATCFAILFLTRSTRRTLETVRSLGAGTLIGGRGLPSGEGDVDVRLGQIIRRPLSGPAGALLTQLEKGTPPAGLIDANNLQSLVEQASAATLSGIARELQQLIGNGSPDVRAAALRGLARSGNLDHVPLLIEALHDPEPIVFHAARGGLQFLSRRLRLPPAPAEPSRAARELEAASWQAWYDTVRPEAARQRGLPPRR